MTRPELRGTFGMVSSTHWLASATGMRILELGGNAFDAVVAAGFVLQVVEPHSNGLGGEVPILAAPARRDVVVVNGQGPAPAAATIERFTAAGLDLVPGTGLLAACVPGAFDAWMLLLAEHGTMTVGDVLAPAIGYAERGFPVAERVASTIAADAAFFAERWPTTAEVWLDRGRPPAPGTLWRNPDLAATYGQLVSEAEAAGPGRERQIEAARAAFAQGYVAEAVARFAQREGGLITGDDLATFRARTERPVTLDYEGFTVCKTSCWGQGPVFLQQLALLSGFDLAAMTPAEFVHTVVECAKLAFADREAWYGDPDFADVPLDALLSPAYAAERRRLVDAEASFDLRPGTVDGREPPAIRGPVPRGSWADAVAPPGRAAGDTVHVDVADRWGNVVAATPSGGWLQGSPTIPGLGFCLGTRAQMFWLDAEHPNGLSGGKRPRTTLTPTLVLREGEPVLAFGTPGGDTQDQWTLTFFLRHVHHGLNLQAAIDAPMFHTEHFPNSFYPRQASPGTLACEGRLGDEVLDELHARGHDVQVRGDWVLGRLSVVGREPGTGVLKAAANPRGQQGYAVGR